ncbi:hypothetical protein [Pseudoroseomonas sp. WGS1072]|uniref:hypothetical protein n=1 Tax=Roseomonas sp. WGS1072 TaxID=3366816 RepID=UPI003BF2AA05
MTLNGVYVGNDPAVLDQYTNYMGGTSPDLIYVSTGMAHWSDFKASVNHYANMWAGSDATIFWSVPLTVENDASPSWTGSDWGPVPSPQDKATLAEAAAGAFDSHYKDAARAILAAQSNEPVIYIRTGWELNGEFPWSVKSSSDILLFKNAFIKFVQAFRDAEAEMYPSRTTSQFKFEWNVMEQYVGDNGLESVMDLRLGNDQAARHECPQALPL